MATDDFFRSRLDQMIDLRHPLVVLGSRLPWSQIEASLAPLLERRDRAGRLILGADLFGPTETLAGAGVSRAGRPRLPVRLMVSLLYLKHAYGLSDQEVVDRWAENVVWQFFSGMDYYSPHLPCENGQLGRFRQLLGEEGVEQLLKATIEAAVDLKAVRRQDFERVIVDTTVQEKAIAHPTDSRLLEVARAAVVRQAKRVGIELKQSYAREGKTLRRKASGYAQAKQFKRLQRTVKRQRVILGRLLRDVQRRAEAVGVHAPKLTELLSRAARIQTQMPKDSNKLYALHAPEVECIGKGKARQPYEFGVKVSVAVLHRTGLVVGARSMPGNPYDGHSLAEQMEQTNNLLQDLNVKPQLVVVDLGYRGVDGSIEAEILHRGRIKSMTQQQRTWLKRRQAVEPVIGHLKDDHGMRRCWLKGSMGDALNAVLCAAGFNIAWLLRAIVRKGMRAIFLWLRWLVEALGDVPYGQQNRFKRSQLGLLSLVS